MAIAFGAVACDLTQLSQARPLIHLTTLTQPLQLTFVLWRSFGFICLISWTLYAIHNYSVSNKSTTASLVVLNFLNPLMHCYKCWVARRLLIFAQRQMNVGRFRQPATEIDDESEAGAQVPATNLSNSPYTHLYLHCKYTFRAWIQVRQPRSRLWFIKSLILFPLFDNLVPFGILPHVSSCALTQMKAFESLIMPGLSIGHNKYHSQITRRNLSWCQLMSLISIPDTGRL